VRAQVATKVVASMLALESLDDTADIKLYINSQGALRPRRVARAARCGLDAAPAPARCLVWRHAGAVLVCADRRPSILCHGHPGHHRSGEARREHHRHRAVRQHRHAAAGALPCRHLPAQRMQWNPLGAARPCAAHARCCGPEIAEALLQAAGKKNKRFSMPNARIMMHQPAGAAPAAPSPPPRLGQGRACGVMRAARGCCHSARA